MQRNRRLLPRQASRPLGGAAAAEAGWAQWVVAMEGPESRPRPPSPRRPGRSCVLLSSAGYSWALLLQRRNLKSVVWNRTTRILIPLVVGWFIGFPLVRYSFALGREVMQSAEGEASLATAYADTPFTPYLPFASDVFYLAHFWFLYYLLLFYLASLILVLCLDRPAGLA